MTAKKTHGDGCYVRRTGDGNQNCRRGYAL